MLEKNRAPFFAKKSRALMSKFRYIVDVPSGHRVDLLDLTWEMRIRKANLSAADSICRKLLIDSFCGMVRD